ncbi:DASH family cryptochrome [Pseudidiomarina sp. 1APP75-32.1]|uniref:Cryptochrome DASH n=2 Tax=Pseudidiomarina terrestris TaxID=2820060 RepID=A0AAW7R2Q0_9GAMM|nr:DASH family cryptochrome [Pseudidiomarina sp. 1APP75-32.1]MDN7129612.1 DASH family cryptochrome [Pseudidiomarina sp. 1APR75-15]
MKTLSMKHRVGIVWLQNELRTDDNPLLCKAAAECQQLIVLYCANPKWFDANRYGLRSIGERRWRFIWESLTNLDALLQQLGQQLLVLPQSPLHAIAELITAHNVDALYYAEHPGVYERTYAELLKRRYPLLQHHAVCSQSLWEQQQLPFTLADLPDSFSKFRRQLEQNDLRDAIPAPLSSPRQLPPPPAGLLAVPRQPLPVVTAPQHPQFVGGSHAAYEQVQAYFASGAASTYKETRNALDSWSDSTKFSAWLADGSLSVRRLHQQLLNYEQQQGANESTYWIFFELMWREYFHWYGRRHGRSLFAFNGIRQQRPQTSFYAGRWQQWCSGTTPFPIVNACMNQLNATGYLSNRGRQLVASCFVHELQLDWRYGAAFFEQQLIDYDVSSNWGNWQYLAGVGADPRGHRRFDLDKQTRQYDPNGDFIARWHGKVEATLDWVDAADWPIHPPK